MGGKSRKSGGVSKKLIDRLKNNTSDPNCGKIKPKTKQRGLFDEPENVDDPDATSENTT